MSRYSKSDYIKREDALNGCKQWLEPKEQDELDTMWNHGIEACLNEIKHHVPSADVVEARHAEWQLIHKDKNFVKDIYQCSECRFLVTGTQEIAYVYCPYCGARMDGDDNE